MQTGKVSSSRLIGTIIFFFALSLGFSRDGNVFIFHFAFGILSIVAFLLYFQSIKKVKIPFLIKGYFLFVLYAGLSVYWAIDQQLAQAMFWRVAAISYLLLLFYLLNEKYDLKTYFVQGLVSLVVLNFVLYFSPLILSSMIEGSLRYSGTFSNSNELAVVVLFTIFFYTKLRQDNTFTSSPLYYLFLVLSVFLIFTTGSRKGFVFGLLIVFFSILCSRKSRSKFLFITGYILGGTIVGYFAISTGFLGDLETVERLSEFKEFLNGGEGDGSTRWRFYFMQEGIEIFTQNPFFGVGLDNFQTFFGKDLYAHNNYVEILADLGILGFFFLYAIYLYLFIFLKRHKATFMDYLFLFILLALEFFMVSYYMRPFWISLLIFYAMIEDKNQDFQKR